jgi:hypothetical protein
MKFWLALVSKFENDASTSVNGKKLVLKIYTDTIPIIAIDRFQINKGNCLPFLSWRSCASLSRGLTTLTFLIGKEIIIIGILDLKIVTDATNNNDKMSIFFFEHTTRMPISWKLQIHPRIPYG